MRQVIFGLRIEIETAMPHVADDADDRHPFQIRLARVVEGDAFADCFLVRKPFFREGIIDDDDARAVELVALVKEAPLQQRDLQDLKNSGVTSRISSSG